jgi:hypothetical protein
MIITTSLTLVDVMTGSGDSVCDCLSPFLSHFATVVFKRKRMDNGCNDKTRVMVLDERFAC